MVLPNPKELTKKIGLGPKASYETLTAQNVSAARAYIKDYWPKLLRFHPKDEDSLIGLPNPYLVPAQEEGREFDFNELYYWDSYFMAQGLMDAGHKDLLVGIVENLAVLYKKCGIIPNASRTYLTGRSQPPFLSTLILDVYRAYKLDKQWLADMTTVAQDEYAHVWLGQAKPNARQVYRGLSRYYDINYLHDLAEAESGWDMTPRFSRRALDYLPVDLNSLLYKYECDFAQIAKILGHKDEVVRWKQAAHNRQDAVNTLMWSELRGMYFDYNYAKESRGNVSSLAAYYPLWAGLATERQAKKMVENLRRFEHKGGLATTDAVPLMQLRPGVLPTQWAYPNGWAPLHYIVIRGLQNYGYHADAKRIALKWLKNNNDWFVRHGHFLEKYNVVSPARPPLKGVYPSQTGFGWSNAVFERFAQEFLDA